MDGYHLIDDERRAERAVGVLAGPALPGAEWIAEMDGHAAFNAEADVRAANLVLAAVIACAAVGS